METQMTREQYMNRKITHQEYYLHMAKLAGISFENSSMLLEIKAALNSGDEQLNSIQLQRWDSMAMLPWNKSGIAKANKEMGNGHVWSLCDGVCALKAAARYAATEEVK